MDDQQILTHSRMACFRACPRRHEIRYEIGIRPEEDSYHLRVGSAFHAALDAIRKGESVDDAVGPFVKDDYDYAIVAAMVDGYQSRWSDEPLEVVESEMGFSIPLRNPKTGASTPIFRLEGKIDAIVRIPDGRLAIMESKTTSRDFTPGADYWQKLHLDMQPSIYVIAARESGYEVETILYDVTRRPALRPLKATPPEKRKFTKDGRLYAKQRAADEDPEEFAHRVSAWIWENAEKCYARIEIPRFQQDLDECAAEIWQQQQAIRSMQREGSWYRNPGSCFEPFACAYLPICQNGDLEERTPDGFRRSETIHPELSSDASLEG